MAEVNCRHFTGYKPCGLHDVCNNHCPKRSLVGKRILVIHLGAMGAVLRSTSILASLKRKYPNGHVTWVTQKPADQLLQNNPHIDRILTTEHHELLQLRALTFDVAFVIDKSLEASGVLKTTRAKATFGYVTDPMSGSVIPATPAAHEFWELGLSNYKKFHLNRKTENQLLIESLDLGTYRREPYVLELASGEQEEVHQRRIDWANPGQVLVGISTGCSPTIPYKKLTISTQRLLIDRLSQISGVQLVLLGGPDESERNQKIGHGLPVIQSSTTNGPRDGLISTAACDIVVSGDSLGMHMGIALKKWVVAWFGPTCEHEIELFDRGVKVLTRASCSPCWKRECHQVNMCYDQVSLDEIVNGVQRGIYTLTADSDNSTQVLPSVVNP